MKAGCHTNVFGGHLSASRKAGAANLRCVVGRIAEVVFFKGQYTLMNMSDWSLTSRKLNSNQTRTFAVASDSWIVSVRIHNTHSEVIEAGYPHSASPDSESGTPGDTNVMEPLVVTWQTVSGSERFAAASCTLQDWVKM